jgi:hypothetical protein
MNLGKLPKMNSPRFDGDHPKLWQSRYENYFDMYSLIRACGCELPQCTSMARQCVGSSR